ncbi:MAG: thioesterase [Gammaproteobacteria bacterium]|nr:thioesterase [Gammaproteobacteria bacterium]MYG65631.1 thioesterase [Gammaproteobacteria bacterium]
MIFKYETIVRPEWIDYNGHMQDAYYSLVFSHAVDALQDEVGFDEEYRARSGCTIYLLEDHRFYLHEVYEGDHLVVETRVIDVDDKRFHLHLDMRRSGKSVALCEFVELHVRRAPSPLACPMPDFIRAKLENAMRCEQGKFSLRKRSRTLSLR